MVDMVMEASDVGGAAGGIGGVAGGSVEVASSIGGATGVGGTNSVGNSSCYLTCGGPGDAGLASAATGAE